MTSHLSYLSSINKMAACKVKGKVFSPNSDEIPIGVSCGPTHATHVPYPIGAGNNGTIDELISTLPHPPSDDISVQPNLKPKKERVHIMTEKRIEALKKATAQRMKNCAARRAAKEQPISKL